MLDPEEYIEQSYFFETLGERIVQNITFQEALEAARDEALSTTNLPIAIDYMLSELKHQGIFGPAMKNLPHYFTPFQSYLISEAEDDRGRFDLRMALEILRLEAKYRAEGATEQGLFVYQFETLCRNRLNYDRGLDQISRDPAFGDGWRKWILMVRRQVGIIDFAELIFLRSQYFVVDQQRRGVPDPEVEMPILFGEREGKIAWANRRKDPLYLFSALQRQLGYPLVPRPKKADEAEQLLPGLMRRMAAMETRVKILEQEQRQGDFDITQFYRPPDRSPGNDGR